MEIEKSALEIQLDDYFNKEKLARQENNSIKLEEILTQVATLIYEQKDYPLLFSTVKQLTKKRGQSKKAQVQVVQLCMRWINETADKNLKCEFLECIKEVCDKKVYLEVEYARCCLSLVKEKETEAQINEASKILQEVQVETYGSMDRREKLEFILYQMRIMIKKDDYIRLHIVSNKIQPKHLEDQEIYDLKVLYYTYMVRLWLYNNDYLNLAKSYKAIFDTYQKDNAFYLGFNKELDFNFNCEKNNVFQNFVIYTCLETHGPEQQTLLNNIKINYQNELEKDEKLYQLVNNLLVEEITVNNFDHYQLGNFLPFRDETVSAEKHRVDLRIQLIQHNIRIIVKYYSKITLKRISELLNISTTETENQICEMINIKQISGKIDRQNGNVNFRLNKSENELLDEWSSDINQVLNLIDQTCNLIKRE